MADHVWFIPVTGGGSYGVVTAPGQLVVPAWDLNVQWSFSNFPTEAPAAAQPILQVVPITQFTRSTGDEQPNKLNQCYGNWRWRSCSDGENVTVGGQLGVGTVFSRELGNRSWSAVEVYAKYRVNVADRFANVILNICDNSGNEGMPTIETPPINTWQVIKATNEDNWEGWESTNLRAVLTFLGTDDPAKVGETIVDVEWFAFVLTD